MRDLALHIPDYGKALTRLVYPAICQLCATDLRWEEEIICGICRNSLRKLEPPLCTRCARELGPFSAREICHDCEDTTHYFKRAWAVYDYNGHLKRLLHRIKFNSRRSPLGLFKKEMQMFAVKNLPENLAAIVPVPLDWKRSWTRGFNQAKVLAQFVSEVTDCPVMELLEKKRLTTPQSRLKKRERLNNLEGSFRFRAGNNQGILAHQPVLIVDDIYTTGSTARECARALRENGIPNTYVLVLARAGSKWN